MESLFIQKLSFSLFIEGINNLNNGQYEEALQHFNESLSFLLSIPFSLLELDIVISRADCLLRMNLFEESLRDSERAMMASQEIRSAQRLFLAIKLRMRALELTNRFKDAFEMALLCQMMNRKEKNENVEQLRGKLIDECKENSLLRDEVRQGLMTTARQFFDEEKYFAAAVHFTEVIKIVCKDVFVSDAYLYHAKCHLKMGYTKEAKNSCCAVLKHDSDNEEGKTLMEKIDLRIQEEEKTARRKKTKKKACNSSPPIQPATKPAMNKKQRKKEEDRQRREAEKIKAEIEESMIKDQEKMEKQLANKTPHVDKEPSFPSYDVQAAYEATGSARKDTAIKSQVHAVISDIPRSTNRSGKKSTANSSKSTSKVTRAVSSKASSNNSIKESTAFHHGVVRNGENSKFPSVPKTNKTQMLEAPRILPVQCSSRPRSCSAESKQQNADHRMAESDKSNRETPDDGWTLVTSKHRSAPTDKPQEGDPRGAGKSPESFLTQQKSGSTKSKTKSKTNKELPPASRYSVTNNSSEFRQLQVKPPRSDQLKNEVKSARAISLCTPSDYFNAEPVNQSHMDPDAVVHRSPSTSKGSDVKAIQQHHDLEQRLHTNQLTDCTDAIFTSDEPVNLTARACDLPKGVLLLCEHFLQYRKKTVAKPCISCARQSKFVYGAWNNSKGEWQKMRPCPKLNLTVAFQKCWHFDNGLKCRKNPCTFAHGETELAFWTLQRQGVLCVPEKSPTSRLPKHSPDDPQTSQPRETLTTHHPMKTSQQFQPQVANKGDHTFCKWRTSNQVCSPFVHGVEELQEGKPQDTLPKPEIKMVSSLPGVEVCLEPLTNNITLRDKKDRHTFQWTLSIVYKVDEVGRLKQIDLLHRYHHCYRLLSVTGYLKKGRIFSEQPEARWYHNPPPVNGTGPVTVKVCVAFESTVVGTFSQCLGFCFGNGGYLIQGLNVDIASEAVLSVISEVRRELKVDSPIWKHATMDFVPLPQTSCSTLNEKLLKKYKLPDRMENVVSAQLIEGNVTCESYRRVMHQLLFVEECFMEKEISQYILHVVQLQCKRWFFSELSGMTFAEEGELFGLMRLQKDDTLNTDTSAGRLLLRNVCSVWIRMSGCSSSRVYEVPIEKVERESVVVRLPQVACADLQLVDDRAVSVDAKFQLNRQPLCEQHAAIDRLGPMQMNLLFPADERLLQVTEEVNFRWNSVLDPRLNMNQQEVIRRISAHRESAPPLVIFGPFGTGKTFTLNQAVRHLITNKSNRVLLCTHSNKAADLHVELLHEYLTKGNGILASRPLRIYQPMRRLETASATARKYCLIENNAFVLPTREVVIKHRVVITTLATSQLLLELDLNHGVFTHILVDEAAQALESEALIPLALAGPNTKVVLTGDHMQMSPEVYSPHARKYGLQRSLPERLFSQYKSELQSGESDIPHVIFLTENYRCHPEILQFPSDNFYGKELIARGNQAAHPRLGPLMFFSARGKDELTDHSYINAAEVDEVVRRVKELAHDWPGDWGLRALSQIAVLSAYRAQVQAIRASLRKEDKMLKDVTVDTIHNVQGQEFRALFISTVRTAHTCENIDQGHYLEFLSDPKLLNTAVTRAKSFIAVIGDPVSLCTIGECRTNWRDFIKRCDGHQMLHGSSLKELQTEISALLDKISLNPEAASFVPGANKVNNEGPATVQEGITGTSVINQSNPEQQSNKSGKVSTGKKLITEEFEPEEEHDEHEMYTLSQEEEEDATSDMIGLLDDFSEEQLDDASVPPRFMDAIIRALVKKCKETQKEETKHFGSLEFPPLEASKSTTGPPKGNDFRLRQQGNASKTDFSSDDYQIRFSNGRPVVHLVNLEIHQTPSLRPKDLAVASSQQPFLDPELSRRLLLDEPEKYVACTLRLSSERPRTAYAVVSDTETPDIKIHGRIKQAFDMDRVVIEKMDAQRSTEQITQCLHGKIIGVLEHIISPHERQYVCNADFESPGVMLPINKSVTKIVNLSAESRCNGIPMYKIGRDGRTIKLDVMNVEDVLSGKYLYLVQYLQWRFDCVYPLGAIIRKIPKIETLENSMEILFAEHGIRRKFTKETLNEVNTKFPPDWSIPTEEIHTRIKVDRAFTIDPMASLDLDDALSLEKTSNSTYRVGVHIADVSYFVQVGTCLDDEALRRCTSYYPKNEYESIPMLPRELSENHCSLLPGKDRLCLSLFFELSDDGETVGELRIERTVVNSCCKLTYAEAQRIIDDLEVCNREFPQDVQKNIQVLNDLAQRRRKSRLAKGALNHWDRNDDPQEFSAHELVEEMMVLANEEIAKFLSARNPDATPLRTQLPPKDHRMSDWFKEHGKYAKLSLHLRRYFSEEMILKLCGNENDSAELLFKVQESIWSEICHAAENRDLSKLQEYICNEANHPQLAVANSQFRRIQSKAQYVCKGDQPDEKVAHFSLSMPCYTHFTSPIRRYIDLQVHRLVVGFLQNERKPLKEEVAKACRRSNFAKDNAGKFEKSCSRVHLAAQLKRESHSTTAFVSSVDQQAISLEISRQEDDHLTARERRIPTGTFHPKFVEYEQDGFTLQWIFRIYAAPTCGNDNIQGAQESKIVNKILCGQFLGKEKVIDIPGKSWQLMQRAVESEDCSELVTLIRQAQENLLTSTPFSRVPGITGIKADRPDHQEEILTSQGDIQHFYEKKMFLRKFDVAHLQLSARMYNGVLQPEVQLFKITPNLQICLEHRRYPRECFATTTRYYATARYYANIEEYVKSWEPVLAMEAATGAIKDNEGFAIHQLEVKWKMTGKDKTEASFVLSNTYRTNRQLEFHPGDFVCVRVSRKEYAKKGTIVHKSCLSDVDELAKSQPLAFCGQESKKTQLPSDPGAETLSGDTPATENGHAKDKENAKSDDDFWVGHYIMMKKHELEEETTFTMKHHHSSSTLPEGLLDGMSHRCSLNLIHRSLPHRRMFAALCVNLKASSTLVKSICMGREPQQEDFGALPSSSLSIVHNHPQCEFSSLNQYQERAVQEALRKPFTLIQGPPGTGKTVTGVHLAYWFTKKNMRLEAENEVCQDMEDLEDVPVANKGPPQVIYCGPSNKSVDVVADYLLRIPELKIIRVYSDRMVELEFPIPNKLKPLIQATEEETKLTSEQVREISLHHVIRGKNSPYAKELQAFDKMFAADRRMDKRSDQEEVQKYCSLIDTAEKWALQQSGAQIILCTCTVAGSHKIVASCDNIQQCIVDECGMCLEPESLVPLTASGARQVTLIGDHKQLQPIIQDNVAKLLGLNVSMFERLSSRATMLELQYRMQPSICEFPSKYFYEGKLKTAPLVPTHDPRLQSFWPAQRNGRSLPIAFCHVEGEEEVTAIRTSASNEQSKANMKEVSKVVQVAKCLVNKYQVPKSHIAILSPYREQGSKIRERLKGPYEDILVTTIVKSQGSEWNYVILSLVRSTSKDELESEPSLQWLREHLGFLTDEHLMNVGLTRARKGLCIIGNKNLLGKNSMWQNLLEHYEKNGCLVTESWP